MQLPKNIQHYARIQPERPRMPTTTTTTTTTTTIKKLSPTTRRLQRFFCHKAVDPHLDETELCLYDDSDEDDHARIITMPPPPPRAILQLRSNNKQRTNEPVFRVVQGSLTLKNVELRHNSLGTDIWNGNAAIQIQPPMMNSEHDVPPLVVPHPPKPSAYLERVKVTSASGRGIVTIDGGSVVIRNCKVQDCAATGVYVGGPGSQALVEHTDIIRNGLGNSLRRGIARGHSGLYLEQGIAVIRDCNISNNTLSGISAISPENAFLKLSSSDLMGNGTNQVEMPPPGTNAFDQSVVQNVTEATTGTGRARSSIP